MKRILILLIFCLLPFAAFAEEGQPLYPVKDENGLWGYIDCKGSPVIPCRYTFAEEFRGGYAMACRYPEGFIPPEGEHFGTYDLGDGRRMRPEGLYGVIDTHGEWVVPPICQDMLSSDEDGQYAGGRDRGIYLFYLYPTTDGITKVGFFDIPSGFFSGAIYDDVDVLWGHEQDEQYICVEMDGRKGFARRTTGEIVIPCRYDPGYDYDFEGDYCLVMPWDAGSADGWILIDRLGQEVPLPENCRAVSTFSDGLAAVRDSSTDLYGYIDSSGRTVIEPQYILAYGFSEGLACVKLPSGEYAMITPDNTVVLLRPDTMDDRFFSPCCSHGLIRCGMPEDGSVVFFDREGQEAFRLQIDGLTGVGDFKTNGVAFYEAGQEGIAGLFNTEGEVLTPPAFRVTDADFCSDLAEGLFPLTEADTGKTGLVNESGRWVLSPVECISLHTRDGLTEIISYPDWVFVDLEGNELYRFTMWGEDID